ncbi:MAG: Mur ligase family protein [Gammaproteobacteria bacterium]|nr:Mur ligase family protein [Gammaproteobacteria bacterium]
MRPSVEELEEALDIPQPASDSLYLADSRRLTGPGLLWDKPGAIAEVVAREFALDAVEKIWMRQARILLDAVGWADQQCCARQHEDGLNLAISAPMDQLYSAIFVVQAAWHYSACEILQQSPEPLEQMVSDLHGVMQSEANPPLIALQQAAAEQGVDFISDDDELSLGHGCGSQTWRVDQLPIPGDVDWGKLHDVPVAMITGTNGKSTCVRLAAAVATAAGKVAGVTSTDFVRVGEDILDHGDYSGPGGARMLLRDPRLELAFLEVARGGILRRGLALHRAQAALITNVAADHLGQYGINTVPALIEVKFSVFRTLAPGGVLVLNADDEGLVQQAHKLAAEVAAQEKTVSWFSLERANPCIRAALANGSPCGWLEDGSLWYFDGVEQQAVIAVADVPITLAGAARYNVQNALGVMCLSIAFALPMDSVRAGLTEFHNSPQDNPGRFNEFVVEGARVFVDFAHNPHSIAAIAETMQVLPAKRRLLMLGHAGDRSDDDIRGLTAGAFKLSPDHVIITEIPDYLRGRKSGEVSAVIRRECLQQGLQEQQLSFRENPLAGARRALELLQPDDLVLLLVHSDRDAVIQLLESHAGACHSAVSR